MLPICDDENLKIYSIENSARDLARNAPCSELAAAVLEMMKDNNKLEPEFVTDWISPNFNKLMSGLDLGEASHAACERWKAKSSLGNVLVYGDYDTDGVCATVLAMEIFRNKAAQVRYFIPRRDVQGYGLNYDTAKQLASRGCNTLVVVDCGTNDSEILNELSKQGMEIFVFDHHTMAAPPSFPVIVNPCGDVTSNAPAKLCATAVLWSWAWKENIASHEWLKYALDLVALATISDCMPLNNLNRCLVKYGLMLMRRNPRRGLSALFDCLGIDKRRLNEEQLSMRVIPCLNAPGRISSADISVRALLGMGGPEAVYNCARDIVRANRKRQAISEKIAVNISETDEFVLKHVLFDETWPIGVLSGVASRICAQRHSPVALAAPVSGKIRGTLRVPVGGNAVGILSEISSLLDAWGGHRYAAGFSVLMQNWQEVKNSLENLLAKIEIKEEVMQVLNIEPNLITLDEWRRINELGPFGNDNPCPLFYTHHAASDKIEPLGRDGKHSSVRINNAKLLAFNAGLDELNNFNKNITGWVYHPRVDFWRGEEQIQFILDYAVTQGRSEV